MSHTFTRLLAHVVFSTKERHPFIGEEMKPRLLSYMGGILRELQVCELAANAVADHVHLLLSFPATVTVAKALQVVKTNSSRWVHETWPAREFAWQTGYGAFSVSRSKEDDVKSYIARQEEHHRTVTFQDEFRELLRRHGLEFDERYVWDWSGAPEGRKPVAHGVSRGADRSPGEWRNARSGRATR